MGLLDSVITAGAQVFTGWQSTEANKDAARLQTDANNTALALQAKRTDEAIKVADSGYKAGGKTRAAGFNKAADARIAGINAGADNLVDSQNTARDQLVQKEAEARQIAEDGLRKAAELKAAGYDQQAEELRAATMKQLGEYDKQIGELRAGAAKADGQLANQQAQNESGQTYLREQVGRGDALTDDQQYQLDESRRQMGNQLRGSSLAGSGRTAASLLRKVEADSVNQMKGQNRASATAAAGVMANQYNSAGLNRANLAMNEAGQVGGVYANKGSAIVSGAKDATAADVNAATTRSQGVEAVAKVGSDATKAIGGFNAAAALGAGKARSDAAVAVGNEHGQAAGGAAGATADATDRATSQKVSAYTGLANIEGATARDNGAVAANAKTANAAVFNDTVGSVGGIIASRLKDANTK